MATSLVSFAQLAAQHTPQVDAALQRYTDFDDGCPPRLKEAIRYGLLAPGKRLRPLLVLFAAEACGSRSGQALPAACAVEMVHAYSLIHDDLPAMDDDDLRRGRPTCHKRFDEATAILAGDALLARAFEVLADEIQPPSVALECCRTLAHAAGATNLVGGQADDLAGETEDLGGLGVERQLSLLQSIHGRKTGAMIAAAVRLGGLVAQADAEQTRALQEYADRVGLAFQIADDLLDAAGREDVAGKRVGKDIIRGKLTYPGVLGVAESRRRAAEMIERACAAVAPWGETAASLEVLARFVVDRDR
ncbi:MAG: polyprenyl synthetase family protein [Planctomycetales bacterium]|nr:polyprenyl synthetase family protein [Planctomycetales bacterium]